MKIELSLIIVGPILMYLSKQFRRFSWECVFVILETKFIAKFLMQRYVTLVDDFAAADHYNLYQPLFSEKKRVKLVFCY